MQVSLRRFPIKCGRTGNRPRMRMADERHWDAPHALGVELARAPRGNVSRADPARAGAVARAVAVESGLVGSAGGGGAGARSPHDRPVAGYLWGGRTERHGLRAGRRSPPALDPTAQATLKVAVQGTPSAVGIDLANWNWKVVRAFVDQQFAQTLGRSSCLKYLHRLGFVLKRPQKRLRKADEAKREAFLAVYLVLRQEAERTGATIFFVDEAHFRADADLRGKWVLKGEPALVDSTSPRLGEKVTYYSAVCLETGDVEQMEVDGTCTAETSAAFLGQLRAHHPEPLIVIWDNGPAHRGEAMRTFLTTPDLRLRIVPLPGYSPDFNADEAIWDWIREDVTANVCLGTTGKVREKVGAFFLGLSGRTDEVTRRCRTLLQARADKLLAANRTIQQPTDHVGFIVALV